jgi:hypothetical protein
LLGGWRTFMHCMFFPANIISCVFETTTTHRLFCESGQRLHIAREQNEKASIIVRIDSDRCEHAYQPDIGIA